MTFEEYLEYLREDKYASESLIILRFGKESDEYQVIRAALNNTWSKVNKFAKKRQETAWSNIFEFFSQGRDILSCRYSILREVYERYAVLGPYLITKLALLDAVFKDIEGEEKDYLFLDEILKYCAEQGWVKYTELEDNNLSIDYVVDPNINWPED